MTSPRNLHIRRVQLGILVSTAAFWVGAFGLVVFSTKVCSAPEPGQALGYSHGNAPPEQGRPQVRVGVAR